MLLNWNSIAHDPWFLQDRQKQMRMDGTHRRKIRILCMC
uniref:Uncharacterized protein n=1 Tax=Arundo donax TaxID=35708 RepID=A0A0A9EHH8_ARUDO